MIIIVDHGSHNVSTSYWRMLIANYVNVRRPPRINSNAKARRKPRAPEQPTARYMPHGRAVSPLTAAQPASAIPLTRLGLCHNPRLIRGLIRGLCATAVSPLTAAQPANAIPVARLGLYHKTYARLSAQETMLPENNLPEIYEKLKKELQLSPPPLSPAPVAHGSLTNQPQ